jgi:hypothetical protein
MVNSSDVGQSFCSDTAQNEFVLAACCWSDSPRGASSESTCPTDDAGTRSCAGMIHSDDACMTEVRWELVQLGTSHAFWQCGDDEAELNYAQ